MVTTTQRHKLNRDPISDAHIILLEFQEDGESTIHRAAVNNEDVISNGNTYTGFAISISLPGSSDADQNVTIEASNITRDLGRAFANAKRQVGCRIMLVDSSAPNTAILDTGNSLLIRDVTITGSTISASLGSRAPLDEPYPWRRTNKIFFPGLFFRK
jgi:hypothetical protein